VGFLIDTNLWIAIERGDLSVADLNAITRQDHVYISPINLAEVQIGFELINDSKRKLETLASLRRMRRKPLLRITGETAGIYARLAATLLRNSHSVNIRVHDLWLAAQAIQRDFTLVTANAKDFEDILDLKLIVLKP